MSEQDPSTQQTQVIPRVIHKLPGKLPGEPGWEPPPIRQLPCGHSQADLKVIDCPRCQLPFLACPRCQDVANTDPLVCSICRRELDEQFEALVLGGDTGAA